VAGTHEIRSVHGPELGPTSLIKKQLKTIKRKESFSHYRMVKSVTYCH